MASPKYYFTNYLHLNNLKKTLFFRLDWVVADSEPTADVWGLNSFVLGLASRVRVLGRKI